MDLGELRALTKDLPDNTKIITEANNAELGRAVTDINGIRITDVRRTTKTCTDMFDGTVFDTPVYKEYTEGKGHKALYIY